MHFQKWLKDNNIEMYSTHKEGKSVVAERFIKTLKNKIYKHITGVSKNVYFDVLDDIINEYNNTHHKTIKMKPIDVKNDSFSEYFFSININIQQQVNLQSPGTKKFKQCLGITKKPNIIMSLMKKILNSK